MNVLPQHIAYLESFNSIDYENMVAYAIARALQVYTKVFLIDSYKSTIIVDGLKKFEVKRMSRMIRVNGVTTHVVRGMKDESNALLRLADSIAGAIRDGEIKKKFVKRL